MDEEISNNEPGKNDTAIEIKLGDVVIITDPQNDMLNGQTFLIDYIDDDKMFVINVDSMERTKIRFNEDGTMGDGTISKLEIISRSDEPGYARQHGLFTGIWVDVHFAGDFPIVFTGEITNLEKDMIEITVYNDTDEKDVIYINFDYKGLPEDMPIRLIEIRSKPQSLMVERESEKPARVEISVPVQDLKAKLRDFIINGNKFGDELFGPITQQVDVSRFAQRYSIDVQVTDLLDEMLSTIPSVQRTDRVLDNIHIMIERFKQLRLQFSIVDTYGNIEGINKKGHDYKPLEEYFNDFHNNMYWILPVVRNVKKIYESTDDVLENSDYVPLSMDMAEVKSIFEHYKSDNDENKYSVLWNEINNKFMPFESIDSEEVKHALIEKTVHTDINTVIDNLDNIYSSVFAKQTVNRRRFVSQRYNLGLNRSELSETNKKMTKMVTVTNNDVMTIKSIMMLPEPAIRFSRINMPGTNILDKSNLNHTFLNYWQFLKKKTNVDVISVDLKNQIVFDDARFANSIKNFVLSIEDNKTELSKDEIYKSFINTLVPRTKIIFNLMKKYITGKLSIVEVVGYLEPFMIYTDQLTYKQYDVITTFISEQISKYNVTFGERATVFSKLKSMTGEEKTNLSVHTIIAVLQNTDDVINAYNISLDTKLFSNSEVVRNLLLTDSLRLYTDAITLQNASLMFPKEFSSLLESDKAQIDESLKDATEKCDQIVVAKRYADLSDLEADNNKDIFFDKRYDTTNYGLKDEYDADMLKMKPDVFILHLETKLKKKLKLNDADAKYLAETLINGYKKILPGQYALLTKEFEVDPNMMYDYYVRKNNVWELVDKPVPNSVSEDSNILCNLQDKCISVNTNISEKCDGIPTTKLELRKKMLNQLVSEFDEKYMMSQADYNQKINNQYKRSYNNIKQLQSIDKSMLFKYNKQKRDMVSSDLGVEVLETSQSFRIRNLILSQTDIVQQSDDLLKFVVNYTRPAYPDAEDQNWLYCKESSVKILPVFRYELAIRRINGVDSYNDYLVVLKQTIGATSDDGNKWVDKHSGWTICDIDLDVEEGYDEGFKVSTRDVIKSDFGVQVVPGTTIKVMTTQTRMIINIVNTVSHNMGINIDKQLDFIINCVTISLGKIDKESDYDTKIKESAHRGKIIPSYVDFCNSYLLYSTLGMFLIAVQTSVPSVKTRKTFPGCVKSFTGYPLDIKGDLGSLKYLSCVVYKIRSSRSEPWNVLKSVKEATIENKIKLFIDDVLWPMTDVQRKLDEKINDKLSGVSEELPEEYSLANWSHFLPPLVSFKSVKPQDISAEFKSKLMHDMKYGSDNQRDKLSIVESKIIHFSLALQERIQTIVKNKETLLHNSNNEPFLENACCNGKNGFNTIQYFQNEDSSIKEYDQVVGRLENLLRDINVYSTACLFHGAEDTKSKHPPLNNSYNEQTIYLAFIHFCKFNSLSPVPANLLPLCGEKPPIGLLNSNDSISDSVIKLKNDGRDYSEKTLQRLLQLVARNKLVDVGVATPVISSIDRFSGLLQSIGADGDSAVEKQLIEKINRVLDTYNMATTETQTPTKDLNNYLITQTDTMKASISRFIKNNKGPSVTNKSINNTVDFITNISKWSQLNNLVNEPVPEPEPVNRSDDSLFNVVNFYKTFVCDFVSVFPNIILNNVIFSDVYAMKHWKLSDDHSKDINKMIMKYYAKLEVFYENQQLYNILTSIQLSSRNLMLLAKETPCFANINFSDTKIKHVFDERTSNFLFEYYFFKVIMDYINLTDDDDMISSALVKKNNVDDVFSVEETNLDPYVMRGNKQQLKTTIAHLIVVYLDIMENHKDTIDVSHDDIVDRNFKMKEKEKSMITSRLELLTDDQRDADTILKRNKLGVWSKGLQKSLTTYVKEGYDEDRGFHDTMQKLEQQIRRKNTNVVDQNLEQYMEDALEQNEVDAEIDADNDFMGGMNDDYADGNYGGDEVENNDDYN